MDKRFQVFISSTFTDLIDERQAVLKGILEIDHMPAGMELFPASDESAWQLIQEVIDSSDYYVLVVGGRYGSLDATGISYTEKEYEYAHSNKKPVVALLHKNPDNLPRERTETDPEAWERLVAFREKVESNHTCVYWEEAEELKAKVIVGLTSATKKRPAVGWVRADQVPSGSSLQDILKLRDRIAELEQQLAETLTSPPVGAEELMQGDDTYEFNLSFTAIPHIGGAFDRKRYNARMSPTWNEIFAGVAPALINEASDSEVRRAFQLSLEQLARNEFEGIDDLVDHALEQFEFKQHQIDTCMVQLRALGLIRESDKKRSVRDTATYWMLTPYGDQTMVQLRAIRRNPPDRKRSLGHAERSEDGAAET
ncbi:DUF4062 domain-containing protein [Algiphilus sp.]|uniref:DUF4062 domain-containing protein n=1 Tax=Algiphilus sp. TaxID=1872431 RepID=UPI0032ED1EC4